MTDEQPSPRLYHLTEKEWYWVKQCTDEKWLNQCVSLKNIEARTTPSTSAEKVLDEFERFADNGFYVKGFAGTIEERIRKKIAELRSAGSGEQ